MPRVSQANLATLQVVSHDVEVVHRIRAPAGITASQRKEFERVVQAMPADWFSPGNIADLVQYCRHVTTANMIADMIDTAILNGRDDGYIERLIKLQVAESKIINQLMTALRLTPQSVAPSAVSRQQLQQKPSLWSGFGKAKEIEGKATDDGSA